MRQCQVINNTTSSLKAARERSLFSHFKVEEEKTEIQSLQGANPSTYYIQVEKEDNSPNPSSSKGEDLTIDYKQVSLSTTTESSSMEDTDPRDTSLAHKNQDDHLILSAKAEMSRVREENEKLKLTLSQFLKNYKSLQMHFHDVFRQEASKEVKNSCLPTNQEDEEPELVCLSLGRVSDKPKSDEKKANRLSKGKEDSEYDQALTLGLDCKFDLTKKSSPENSSSESKEEEVPPIKDLKTERNEDSNDLLQQIPLKKARVSVRAICNAPTMNDGGQWRKYGQKIAKGNPCPRAYYRCTVSTSCPVRKHVQRCADNKSVLITTYEGTHNHPLPVSATAMASTTSAAVSMLNSTSSTSQPGPGGSTTTFASLHGVNYNSRVQQYPVYIPSTTISTYQSHPTITLDLTTASSNFLTAPRFPPTCLNFSSPASSSSSIESNYKNHIGFSYLGRQSLKEAFYQTTYVHSNPKQQSSAETKALTSNPTFQSALPASIMSFVGNVGDGGRM